MRIQLESTDKIIRVNGVAARLWEGHTETGIEVHALITRIGVHKDSDCSQFEAELTECRPPSRMLSEAYPNAITI
jgi:hypothetical protein